MNPITIWLPRILKRIEIAGIVITVFGVLFKILHYAGSNELLTIGLLILSSAYFLFSFVSVSVSEKNNEKLKGIADFSVLILRKLLFISLSVFCIAYLFTLLHFPGANEMMMIGMSAMVISSLISIFLILGKRERIEFLSYPLSRSVAVITWFLISMF